MSVSKDTVMIAVFLGPPGSGKGTQAGKLASNKKYVHISTGDLLRDIMASGSALGTKVADFVNNGLLVTDDLMGEIVEDRLRKDDCKAGVILDGYPRNTLQAHVLEALLKRLGLKIGIVIEFKIDDELLVTRITGRLLHKASGRTYHETFNPPRVPMKDDITGDALIRRKDDTEEVLRSRLSIFHDQTSPLVQHFKTPDCVYHVIDASKSPDTVYGELTQLFKQF